MHWCRCETTVQIRKEVGWMTGHYSYFGGMQLTLLQLGVVWLDLIVTNANKYVGSMLYAALLFLKETAAYSDSDFGKWWSYKERFRVGRWKKRKIHSSSYSVILMQHNLKFICIGANFHLITTIHIFNHITQLAYSSPPEEPADSQWFWTLHTRLLSQFKSESQGYPASLVIPSPLIT